MDETDTGTTAERETRSAEAAREWARQQRAQARAQFATPTWIGPDRGTAAPIPAQPEPEHDELDLLVTSVPSVSIPDAAHWSEKAPPRLFAGTFLFLASVGVVVSLVYTVTTQSPVAIAGLAASAIVMVIFRGALMSAPLTSVDVKGSMLTVRRGGSTDTVNLADPVHLVELVGAPDQPTWRLRFETVDGRTLEIGPKLVEAPELHQIVEHYLAVADRARRDREQRFRR